jgi:hypothetical protein
MKPIKRLSDLKGRSKESQTYMPPTPKVTRQKQGRVLSDVEREAFLASRPDLAPKG